VTSSISVFEAAIRVKSTHLIDVYIIMSLLITNSKPQWMRPSSMSYVDLTEGNALAFRRPVSLVIL